MVAVENNIPSGYYILSSASSVSSSFGQQVPNFIENDTYAAPTPEDLEESPFPLYAIITVAVVIFVMSSAVLYFLCRCIMKQRRKRNQLASMTPKTSDPRLAGVRADQPIQFVVPTTIVITETTEDSLSDTDYSSGGPRSLPMLADRKRKRTMVGFHINPEDLERGLYEGVAAGEKNRAFLGDLGKVGFSMHYNYLRHQLCVRLIGATDLPCLFLKTTANPCAKIVLLPDRSPKYLTKVQRNTMNPVFNEMFIFPVRKEDLDSKKIKISIWDYDRFSRKLLIGQIVYDIKDCGITSSIVGDATTGDIWVNLKQESDFRHGGNGELLFSLCYNPDTASLTLSILKARGLAIGEKEKDTAVYAKVTLYVRRKLVRTKKTSSKKKTPQVEFNNSFDIHVPQGALSEVDLLVTLCERSGLGGKRMIGRTQVGSNCLSDQGLQHWQDMLMSSKSTCAQWHVLSG